MLESFDMVSTVNMQVLFLDYDKYPKLPIALIMVMEFGEKLSFCAIRTLLAIYLRNALLFGEQEATIIYHAFIVLCYIAPIFGAVIADSYWGRFKTIFYFGVVYCVGIVMLFLSAVQFFNSSAVFFTIVGLLLIALGTGGLKPCIAIFGGDQFLRVAEKKRFHDRYISVYFWVVNLGSLLGMIIAPLLRNYHCFGQESCYTLGFGIPAIVVITSLAIFKTGEPIYRKKKPKNNVIFQFCSCLLSAVGEKIKKPHKTTSKFFNLVRHKYDDRLIRDMNAVLNILVIYIPLPVFWSLNDQQGSTWTFQASRTENHVFGYYVAPDQVQVLNPIFVLLLIPILEKFIYPILGSRDVLVSPLHRMAAGGYTSSKSFFLASLMERKLKNTYPSLPGPNISYVNFINLLPCAVQIINPFNSLQVVAANNSYQFNNVAATNTSSYTVDIVTKYSCADVSLKSPWIRIPINPHERNVSSFFIYEDEFKVAYLKTDSDNLEKSLTGKSRLRIIIIESNNIIGGTEVNITSNEYYKSFNYISTIDGQLSISIFRELESGSYNFTIKNFNEEKNQSNIDMLKGVFELKTGGVYSFMVQRNETKVKYNQLLVMTPPNRVSVVWLIPQYLFISIGESLFAKSGISFSIAQAPKSMKSVTLSAWYLSIAFGNLIIITVTELRIFNSQQIEFLFYTFLAVATMSVFMLISAHYKFTHYESEESSTTEMATSYTAGDETPLIFGKSLSDANIHE